MKAERLRLAAIFMLVTATAGPAIPALSTTASTNTTVVNIAFNGITAIARWDLESPDRCIDTRTEVFASQGPGTDNGSGRRTGPIAHVYTGSFDICTAQTLFFGSGSVDLSAGQFTVDHSLGVATLRATVPVFDRVSGNTINFDVDMTWTATDGPVETRVVSHETYADGSREIRHSNGTVRNATASGTVSNGAVNLAPTPAPGSSIEKATSGDLTISR